MTSIVWPLAKRRKSGAAGTNNSTSGKCLVTINNCLELRCKAAHERGDAMLTEREQQILGWIRANPSISQQEIASRAGISRSSVSVHISNLTKKGAILGQAIRACRHLMSLWWSHQHGCGGQAGRVPTRATSPGTIVVSPRRHRAKRGAQPHATWNQHQAGNRLGEDVRARGSPRGAWRWAWTRGIGDCSRWNHLYLRLYPG